MHLALYVLDQASSSVESLGGQEAMQVTKSYDAVVFDVLKVTPEHFAVSAPPLQLICMMMM